MMYKWKRLRLLAAFREAKKVEDTVDLFTSDTLKGGAKKPELVKVTT